MNKKWFKFLTLFALIGCSKAYYPPNTQYLTDSKFMDVSYIENIHILEFLQYVEADTTNLVACADTDNGLFERIKPKTAMGIDGESNLTYMYGYLHRNVPVPMTLKLATAYCKWRSEIVTCEKNFGAKNIPKHYCDLIKKNEEATIIIKFMIPTKLDLHIADESRTKFKRYNPILTHYQALTSDIEDMEGLYFLRCVAVIRHNLTTF
jgi:hypothetical protein